MNKLPVLVIQGWLFIACFCLSSASFAQTFTFAYDTLTPLIVQDDTLHNAWAGGLNAGQYSTIELNNDGLNDLVVFDRTSNKLTTFIASPQGNSYRFQHVPYYESQFPEGLQSWLLLADYNNDGKKDIFTHTNLGIKVYKNTSTTAQLQWQLVADPLESQGFSGIINLYVSSTDIPALVDVDEDGDLDIFTFDDVGGAIEFHINLSKDKTGNTETLDYQKVNACWGKLRQGTACEEFYFDVDCGEGIGRIGSELRIKHTGSSLLLLDLDGDGDKDLLNGHTGCDNLAMLTNQGSINQARFTGFTTQFPINTPITYPSFPAVYYEDLDFDGIKDLISSPNMYVNELNQTDFAASSWLYKNIGTASQPEFLLQQKDFLQATMLEVGENASPALADYDADGDMDLFVGNRGKWDADANIFYATIALYENTGNAQKARFTFVTDNYLNLSSLALTDIKPYFGDINGDRVIDLVFANTDKTGRTTELKYMLNQAPREQAFSFSLNSMQKLAVPFTTNDSPLLYDLDGDKDLDALVGKFTGNIEYYKNTGSATSPVYTLENEVLWNLPTDPLARNIALSVSDFNNDGKPDLLIADRRGVMQIVSDFLSQLNKPISGETEIIWDEFQKKYVSSRLEGMLIPTTADINGDNLPEIFAGTQGGGIMLLTNTGEGGNPNPTPQEASMVFPNPTNRYIYLNPPAQADVAVYSMVGQELITRKALPANQITSIDLHHLPAGVYVVKILSGEVSTVKKIVLYR